MRHLLMIDECFLDFVEHGDLYSMKAGLPDNPEFFILKAFTKRYAMAGIRLGYGLCGSRKLLEKMEKMTQPWNVSIPAQAAGCAALKETEYVRMAQRLVNEQREYLKREMQKLPLSVYDSKANYIFSGAGGFIRAMPGKGILIRDCSNYPGLESGFFRIAVRMPERKTNDYCQCLAKCCRQGGKRHGKGDHGAGHDVECGKKPADSRIVPHF